MRTASVNTFVVPFAVSPAFDGWLTVSTGFVIASLIAEGRLTLAEASLLAGSFMTGTFLGASLIGRLADRFGRKPFARCLIALTVPLLAFPLLRPDPDLLIDIHLLLGVLIGADQPVSQAVMTESGDVTKASRRLSVLMFAWYAGALAAVALLPFVNAIVLGWQAFYAAPLLAALLLTPVRALSEETPAWLSGRADTPKAGLAAVLRSRPREWLFCCGFWLCQTIPVTAIMFYSPIILADVAGSADQTGRIALIYSLFMAGTLPMTLMKRRIAPSRILRWSALAMAGALAGVALFGRASPLLLSLFFGVYAFAYGLQTTLDNLYPNRLFPAGLRASAVGSILAVSRVGSAASALVFPHLMSHYSIGAILLGGTAVALCGALCLRILPDASGSD